MFEKMKSSLQLVNWHLDWEDKKMDILNQDKGIISFVQRSKAKLKSNEQNNKEVKQRLKSQNWYKK